MHVAKLRRHIYMLRVAARPGDVVGVYGDGAGFFPVALKQCFGDGALIVCQCDRVERFRFTGPMAAAAGGERTCSGRREQKKQATARRRSAAHELTPLLPLSP